jgi:hypothetical protein
MGRAVATPPSVPAAAAPPVANVAPPIPPLAVMKGGAREQVLDIVRKYARPLEFYFGVVLVLGIVYVGQIPEHIAYQANTLLGRLLLFWATVFVADLYSWIYALLMALFTVLLISVAPRTQAEGFQMLKAVETIPVAASTGANMEVAIQDGNNSSNSTTSSTGR